MKLLIPVIFVLLFSAALQGQVVVVANKSVPVDTISKSQLLDYFSREVRVWKDNQPIILFDLKQRGEVKDTFYRYIGKSSSRMKSIWMKKLLSGEGEPPEALPDEAEVLRRVQSTPGAMGFLRRENATGEVKVLLVIKSRKG